MVVGYRTLEREYASISLSCATSGVDYDISTMPMYAIGDVFLCAYCRRNNIFSSTKNTCDGCGAPIDIGVTYIR